MLGTNNIAARDRVFQEKNVTLDNAIDICRTSESAENQLKEVAKPREIQHVRKSRGTKIITAPNKRHASKKRYTVNANTVVIHIGTAVKTAQPTGNSATSVANYTILQMCAKSEKTNYLENSERDSEHCLEHRA